MRGFAANEEWRMQNEEWPNTEGNPVSRRFCILHSIFFILHSSLAAMPREHALDLFTAPGR